MPRTTKDAIEISHPAMRSLEHPARLSPSTSLSKPQRPKSKSLQPCRCVHEGCGKIFSKRSNLKAHMRVHSGVLPYPCEFPGCSKRFRWKSSLKPHIRVHIASGDFPNSTQGSTTLLNPSASNTTISPDIDGQVINGNGHAKTTFSLATPTKPYFKGRLLEIPTQPAVPESTQHGEQSPTSINHTALFEATQDCTEGHRVQSSQPTSKPSVARVLFQESHDQNEMSTNGDIDLSTDSVLSSSEGSYETDIVSFTLDSPVEEQPDDMQNQDLTEELWKNDLDVIDPFVEFSATMTPVSKDLAVLSGFANPSGISTTNMESVIASDSPWILESSGSTASSTDFAANLHSFTTV